MSSKFVNKINWLSFSFAICVVAIHAGRLASVSHGRSIVEWVTYVCEWLLAVGIGASAVPFFFLVSGFFLAKHYGSAGWYQAALAKRAMTLLLPYVIFSLLNYAIVRTGSISSVLGLHIFDFPQVRSYWYIRSLILFVAASILFLPIVERLPLSFVLIGGSLTCLGMQCLYVYFKSLGNSYVLLLGMTRGFVYFFVGSRMYRLASEIPVDASKLRKYLCVCILALMLAVMLFLSASDVNPYLCGIFSETILPVVIVGGWIVAPTIELPAMLRRSCFAIYMMHILLMESILGCVLSHLRIEGIHFLLCMLSGVGLSILIKYSLDAVFPRVAQVLFGGR